MIELSIIRDLVAIFGVIAGFSYYYLTVRNANITRKIDQARRILDRNQDVAITLLWKELVDMEWDDYDDFIDKYDWRTNTENWAKRTKMFGYCNEAGYMLYHTQIDIETLNSMIGDLGTIRLWNKFGSVIVTERERENDKDYCKWFEYFVTEMGKERARRGVKPDIEDIIKY